jgi:Domain of Unknown Function (DUF1907)
MVALGGVWQVEKGRVRAHCMPDFPSDACDFDGTSNRVADWLHFFEADAPLTMYSVLVNSDVQELALRVEHTHFVSSSSSSSSSSPIVAGHYHHDTVVDVEHHGLFAPARRLVRIKKEL